MSRLRLQLRPEPPQVSDARPREIHCTCRRIGERCLRPNLGPGDAFIQRLPGESVERLNPHAWIDQNVVDFRGTYNGILRGGTQYAEQKEGKEEEKFPQFSITLK